MTTCTIYENPRYRTDPSYTLNPSYKISGQLRNLLMNWVIEVHLSYYQTLYFLVLLVFLRMVAVDQLELIGVTSAFIAPKFEEIKAPKHGLFSILY